jgi:CheY-like chemotaxis protein
VTGSLVHDARMSAPAHDDAEDREITPPGATSLRVVVVDADDRTRESIVGLLGIRERFRVVGSAGHLGAAVRLVEQHRPDVVILDPRLPDVSGGAALIRAIRGIDPEIRVLALGWSPELEHHSLEAGADGFVRKTFKPADLADAIARCMDTRRPAGSSGDGTPDPGDAAGGAPDPSPAATTVPGTGFIL